MGFWSKTDKRRLLLAALALVLTALLLAGLLLHAAYAPSDGAGLEVLFLDTGNSDCVLVSCDGAHMLIDGGDRDDAQRVYAMLKARGIEHLDVVVATHAHADHVGGLAAALTACSAGTVYCPVEDYDSESFRDFLAKVRERGLALTHPSAGDVFHLGAARVRVLGPVGDYSDVNNTSIVLRLSYGGLRLVFAADAEEAALRDIVDSGAALRGDVLKLSHHGGADGSPAFWLEAVSPRFAVITVGEGNSYGHPHDETLRLLDELGATVWRTDLDGDVLLRCDGGELSFSVEKRR